MDIRNVVIIGANGKMGKEVIKGLSKHDEIRIVGAVDIQNIGMDIGELIGGNPQGTEISDSLERLINSSNIPIHIVIDFTRGDSARKNVLLALKNGISVVMGTTGLNDDDFQKFDELARENHVGAFFTPNYSLGAVVMMKYANEISKYFEDAEIIEYHNDQKVDSPSGTALTTAHFMKNGHGNRPQVTHEEEGSQHNCRGGEFYGIKIHSVRLKSLIAHQEVLFSGCGEMLTIRHDSFSRESFLPGIIMAIKKVNSWKGLRIGLETILDR